MTYTPSHLYRWTLPESYFGAQWPEYYSFLGQTRDSDSLTRSNFTCGLAALGGESDTVIIVRENHWACGWVEWIAIHQDDHDALRKADVVMASLADYPVVNEDHWSELEAQEAEDFWASLSVWERCQYIKDYTDGECSIFAARRDYPPLGCDVLDEVLRS